MPQLHQSSGVPDDHKPSTISEQRPYAYVPLQASSEKIRLLTLLPGPFGTDIHCQLHEEDLQTSPPPCYEALSYTWGSVEDPVLIYIDKCTLSVTENLAKALQHLRHEDHRRTLWIDAICVNQQDVDERSQQVPRIANIYTLAECVVVWIGPEADNSPHILRTLNRIGSMIDVDWGDYTMKPSDEARGLGELHWADQNAGMPFKSGMLHPALPLLERAWFERLWIRQEIGLATKATVVCGFESVSWSSFRNAIFYLYFKVRKDPEVVEDMVKFSILLTSVFGLCTPTRSSALTQQVYRTRDCKCSDQRDRIYALLSICDTPGGEEIIVDYRKSPDEVYRDVALQSYKFGLFTLAACEMQDPLSVRPSWVPNWGIPPLVELFPENRAGGNSAALLKHMGGNHLKIIGFRVAGIEAANCMTFPEGEERELITVILTVNWFLSPIFDLKSDHGLDIFCRTLHCDQFNKTYDPPLADYLSFETCQEILREILDTDGFPLSSSTAHRQLFLAHAVSGLKNRTFLWTEDGRMGVGPGLARATDEIVVFPGCPQPMVLRPSHNGNGKYRIVGPCFLYGLTSGEALLGPLPDDYERIRKLDRTVTAWDDAFRDRRTGKIQDEDPRFSSLQTEVQEDGMRWVYPQGLPMIQGKFPFLGVEMYTKRFWGEGEKVRVFRNDLQPFLIE